MPTVGEIIKAEREKKGLSIKDIEKGTSIRGLYLQAIEDGNYSIVPGEVYLKGFIRNYANFIGLDGQEMVNLYKESQNIVTTPPVTEEKEKEQEKEQQPQPVAEHHQTTRTKLASQRSSSSKKWIAAVVAILLVGGIYAWQSSSKPVPPQERATPETTAVQPAPQTAPQQAAQTHPVTIVAKYADSCWTSVKTDGKQIYEGTPKAGETQTWNAQQNIEIRLGNAGAVDITYNGNTIGKLGNKGEVIVKKFTKQ